MGGEKEKVGYPLSPTKYWMFWFNLSASCSGLLYIIIEIILDIRAFLLGLTKKTAKPRNNDKGPSQTNAVESKSSNCSPEVLQKWLERPTFDHDDATFHYDSRQTRMEMVVMMSIFAAFTRVAYRHVMFDRDLEGTAEKLQAVVRIIRTRAEASEKFRIVFKELLQLLDDVERSSTASIARFLREWAGDMTAYGNAWYIWFGHRRVNSKHVPEALYEATMATYALFHAQGAGLEAYYMNGHWREENRSFYGALTLLMFFAFDKCSPPESSALVKTERSGVERILLVGPGFQFHRFLGYTSARDNHLFKDLMMWDITRNCCNDFVESSWSVSCLERVIWTLEYGRRHVSMELYEHLKEQHGQRRLDMTHLSALSLMTFSIAGLIRFRGLGEGPYGITGSLEATVELHGNLPAPTIGDLIGLNILETNGMGRVWVKKLPGSHNKFKAVAVGNSIKFVKSVKDESFKADMCQQVT